MVIAWTNADNFPWRHMGLLDPNELLHWDLNKTAVTLQTKILIVFHKNFFSNSNLFLIQIGSEIFYVQKSATQAKNTHILSQVTLG